MDVTGRRIRGGEERFVHPVNLLLDARGFRPAAGFGGFEEADEKFGGEVGSAADAARRAAAQTFEEELFGADPDAEAGAILREPEEAFEVGEVAGAVFDAGDAREFEGAGDEGKIEGDLREDGDVVEEEGKRDGVVEALEVAEKFVLGSKEVEGRGGDEEVGPGFGGEVREADTFGEGGVADGDEGASAAVGEGAGAADEFGPEAVAEGRSFAGGAEEEDAGNAAGERVGDEAFEGFGVE